MRCRVVVVFAGLVLAASGVAAAAQSATDACDYLTRAVAQPGAILLASYPTQHDGPLGAAAYTYDNAVAVVALIACGKTAQARQIGDALLWAQDHDRYWHDGRLRNAYAAGSVGAGPMKLPGWWDIKAQRWLEDGYQAGSDSGNIAWAMLALLALDANTGDPRYRGGAERLGRWVESRLDARGAGGFTGGDFGHEPTPQRLQWKSTEHNTDLAAAFRRLARVTGDQHWRQRSQQAQGFVETMWNAADGYFAVGAGEDGVTINPLLALDAQVWPLMALPGAADRYAAALRTCDRRLRFDAGYTYSEAGGGLWTEGTAQVATMLELLHRAGPAKAAHAAVQGLRTGDGGYYASSEPATPTGFMLATDPSKPRVYFRLEHLGAAAWVALSDQRYNPFSGGPDLP